jgi:hypothetical protein
MELVQDHVQWLALVLMMLSPQVLQAESVSYIVGLELKEESESLPPHCMCYLQSFQWMSRVLQAVDSIHQVGIYCLALVPPNYLPKTPLGGIHLSETKRRFLEGTLHPANVLLCPHTCVTNLPKPREVHSGMLFIQAVS